MTTPPSSPAQALAPPERHELRPLKTRLDELDDDDLAAIGRTLRGHSPRRLVRTVSVVGGIGVSVAVLATAPLAALGVGAAVTLWALLTDRRDMRADFEELGLAPGLAADVVSGVTLRGNLKANLRGLREQLRWPNDDDHRRAARVVVEEATKKQKAAERS